MMSISRWWQLAIGAVFGTTTVFYLPAHGHHDRDGARPDPRVGQPEQ